VCSRIQRVSEHQVERVNLRTLLDLGDKDLRVLFEDIDVAEAVFDELGSDELARVVPLLAVGGEDACMRLLASFRRNLYISRGRFLAVQVFENTAA
jgi:hypothetical protein